MTTTSELKARLENQSEELGEIAHKIENRLEQYTDWKSWVRQHPWQSLGAAFGLGLVFSGAAQPVLKSAYKQVSTTAATGAVAYLSAVAKELLPTPTKIY
jgi:hypothetical protein